MVQLAIYSSPASAAYMRQWLVSALVQIMACRLFGGLLSIGSQGANLSEILIKMQKFSITKMHLKISSAKWGWGGVCVWGVCVGVCVGVWVGCGCVCVWGVGVWGVGVCVWGVCVCAGGPTDAWYWPNKLQTITWNNGRPIPRRIYGSSGPDAFRVCK